MEPLAAADVQDVSGCDGDTAMSPTDPVGRLIEDRRPRAAVVVGLPDAAVVHANEEHSGWVGMPTAPTVRLARNGPMRR